MLASELLNPVKYTFDTLNQHPGGLDGYYLIRNMFSFMLNNTKRQITNIDDKVECHIYEPFSLYLNFDEYSKIKDFLRLNHLGFVLYNDGRLSACFNFSHPESKQVTLVNIDTVNVKKSSLRKIEVRVTVNRML